MPNLPIPNPFISLDALAQYIREEVLQKHVLIFAYNGTGKTRLSMDFRQRGKQTITNDNGDQETIPDTLYFNAFTEDLFTWDNDLENDKYRVLRMNSDSRFFAGLQEWEMENRIRPLLNRYTDLDFFIDYDSWEIVFFRDVDSNNQPIPIKVSRGEESIFIWCFFLSAAQLAVDQEEDSSYEWVKYIYIDDPISSLDDNNVIVMASHLAQFLKDVGQQIRVVVSTHHHLFFNVMCNALRNPAKYFLKEKVNKFWLTETGETPYFHHIAMLKELHKAAESDQIYTYHFNILRGILEKTSIFHGHNRFSDYIKQYSHDSDNVAYIRLMHVLSHNKYSLFDTKEMVPDNKKHFRKILQDFINNHSFAPKLFEVTVDT